MLWRYLPSTPKDFLVISGHLISDLRITIVHLRFYDVGLTVRVRWPGDWPPPSSSGRIDCTCRPGWLRAEPAPRVAISVQRAWLPALFSGWVLRCQLIADCTQYFPQPSPFSLIISFCLTFSLKTFQIISRVSKMFWKNTSLNECSPTSHIHSFLQQVFFNNGT